MGRLSQTMDSGRGKEHFSMISLTLRNLMRTNLLGQSLRLRCSWALLFSLTKRFHILSTGGTIQLHQE